MRKLMAVVVVLIVVGAVYFGAKHLANRFDGLLEREIALAVSEAFGTKVTVGDVRLAMLDGELTIEDLAIGNPPGFNAENAFVFGSIEAAVDYKTRRVDRVVLEEVQIFVEEKAGLVNVQELKRAVESQMTESVTVDQSDDVEEQEELHIKQFLMHRTTATLESDSLQKRSLLEIDQIEMRDLRGTPDQVAEQIASHVVDEISDAAQKALVRAKAEDLGNQALDKLRELLSDDEDGG